MTVLIGSAAYSPFRLDALREAIAKLAPKLGPVNIDAKWVYAIQPDGDSVSETDLARATTLLNATGSCDGADFYVTPRKGTISPWNSKATDIFRNCGLKSIARVERGIRYRVSKPIPPKAMSALYDRMTEGVYDDISDLFAEGEPKPGRTYDVLTKGKIGRAHV